nr:hypothetical protein [Tanacetum cinerariifolium]
MHVSGALLLKEDPEEQPEPEPEPTYAPFAHVAQDNMNGWLEEDDEDEIEVEENDEDDEDEDWLMAPVTPPRATVLLSSTYEMGGPYTSVPELPFPVGPPFSVAVDSVVVNHEEIGGLSVRTENLEHALGKLTMKTIEVSDAQVKDSIAIGEIQPKVTTLEGQVEVLANQHDL